MFANRLRRSVSSLVVIALGLAVSGCATGHRPQVTPTEALLSSTETSRMGLTKRWQNSVTLVKGETVKDAWRVGDSVFVTTSNLILYSLDASSGATNWFADCSANTTHIFRPQISAADRYVYVCTGGHILLLSKDTGDQLLSARLRFSATCDPIAVNLPNFSEICVGGANRFYGLFVDPLGAEDWNVTADREFFRATPAYAFGGLFVSSSKGKLWRLSPRDVNKVSWKDVRVNGEVSAPLTANGAKLLVPCSDRQLYCFDASMGREIWTAQLDGVLDQQAMITPQSILCVGTGKGLYGINPDDGKVKWTIPGIVSISTRMGEHVMVRDGGGNLLAVSAETGEIEGSAAGGYGYQYLRNDEDATLYVVAPDGRIAAFQQTR